MSNIHGFSSKKVEKKENEEEYTQSSAGQSGTAVWRPNNSSARSGPGMDDPINSILAQARAGSGSGAPNPAADRNIGNITLYSNGFIIGNSEFRDLNDAKNKQFVEDLKKGEVPEELEQLCRKEWGNIDTVAINLVDKSKEAYVPPKAKFDFAKSQGQSLGSSSSSSSSTAASFADATPQRLVVDASQPTTTLQIVLADRKKVKETANQTATVMDLYRHIQSLTGLSGFELVAGFPPKPLTNPALTLKEAGLLNGSITQRG